MATEHFDVLIVGAGISGIGAAYHLQKECRGKSYAILEARQALGGTWDLFRYPGIRSDSDMYTFGYPFRPWPEPRAIADGPSILKYLRDTAREYGIDRKIRFGHRVRGASWSSPGAEWTVEVERGGQGEDKEVVELTCNFLYMCTGYYDYAGGYTPEWPGMERFAGRLVHPQQWPIDMDYADKRVVVVGSGATAVTLVPAMAPRSEHVTMLQRSPTYIVSLPSRDRMANWLREHLPTGLAYSLARWKAVLISMYFYLLARWRPVETKKAIMEAARKQLGPGYDVERDFSPTYNPWDQRLCLVPDGDLFAAIRSGKASIVTGYIDTFTETGIRLRSGEELPADIIVTATGLNLRLMCGVQLAVDGVPVDLGKTLSYKGLMYSNVPNLASAIGYTNASWTLRAELTSRYVCRLLRYMDRHGYSRCTPRTRGVAPSGKPILSFTSGYILRALDTLPNQGAKRPWKVYQNYLIDLLILRFGRINDGTMEFKRRRSKSPGKRRVLSKVQGGRSWQTL